MTSRPAIACAHRPAAPYSSGIVRFAACLALALVPAVAGAERFTYLGTQPDGAEIYVQVSPPALRKDGKLQGWFRTVPAAPTPVTDEFGFERRYVDFLALNVADCSTRRMGAAAMHYRDDKGTVVARFELAPTAIEYRDVRPGTLGENMLLSLCTPRPPSAPLPPSAASQTPFK
jgi:hypothetical protein